MKKKQLFSFMLRFVSYVEGSGWGIYMNNIWICHENDFSTAFEKAILTGKGNERSYENADGKLIKWIFKEVISLDIIPDKRNEPFEVYSEFQKIPQEDLKELQNGFDPATSDPTQTI